MRSHSLNGMLTVTSMCVAMPSGLIASAMNVVTRFSISSRSMPEVSAIPALFTSTSSPPIFSRISPNIAITASSSATSPGTARPEPISATVFCAVSALMSFTATVAPSSAKSRLIARPIPEPPPVTRTLRPSSFM